jgi:uncharacterized protein (DUF779 family)
MGRGWLLGLSTPIYMLNRIIWLQAVVEIITNETAKAVGILAKQQTKICNASYPNCLPQKVAYVESSI